MDTRGTVLVVSADGRERARLGGWLEDAGLEVLLCPGPGWGPCVGLTERTCPLALAAGVVVLQASPPVQASPPGGPPVPWLDLAEVYGGLGRPVVALVDAGPAALAAAGARTLLLPARPFRPILVDAVRRALSAGPGLTFDAD